MVIAICPQLEARRTHLRDNNDDSLYNVLAYNVVTW